MLSLQSNTITVLPSVIVMLWSQLVVVPSLRSIAFNLILEAHDASTEHVQVEVPDKGNGYAEFQRKTTLSFVFKFVQGSRP